ncbi:MAG TPA: LacI family DNA-binding transcriptional regulator [Chloroflexia bacterium]|nr:LacI family DNA-binding transcriptional regulator [Chloroflexia bacterium]
MSEVAGKNNVTIRDVATRALVSVGTVSRVLNNYPNVEADLRLRVLNAASELGYSLRKRRADQEPQFFTYNGQEERRILTHIAFCCRPVISPSVPDSHNPYFSLMLRGVEAECRRHNLHLIYRIIEDDASELDYGRRMLAESHADALLLINFINEELVSGLLDLKLPSVLVDHYFPELALDMVSNENYNGSIRAVRYLIEKGHRKIGFINGLAHYTVQRRLEGYRRALEEAGIPFNWDYVIKGDLTIDGGVNAAHEVARKGVDCTAYFCANDQTAFGFLQGLRAHGLEVPRDISVVGFDDTETARLVTPALTTVRADPEGLGRMAVRKIIERVNYPDLPVTQTLLYTSLVERDSVRSLK